MGNFNILFTSAGRRVSLIRHFKQILGEMNLKGKIVTTDLQRNAPAPFVSDFKELVPRVTEPNYIEVLKEICQRHAIKLLIPLIDTELELLALHRTEFAKKGVTVLVSSKETNEICFDKRKTHDFFLRAGVQTPRILDPEKILSDPVAEYPFLLKPARGSSSIGVTKINNAKELDFFKEYVPEPIIQELVVGDEYTIDVLVDLNGNICSVVPRLRIETRAGEVSKGMTVKNPAIIVAGMKVVEALPGAVGCITVQCFLTPSGDIKFIEINPRFGGGFPLSSQAGADFPRWIIEMILGCKKQIAFDSWQDGVVMLRYDDAIFVSKEMIW
ncbi:MAG: ATP-grasp domain-containing protein [Carboxydocellales bacterium]|jgi:carbamoyl-phosphate synthase large subunit